jgi:hypothetical protein
MRNNEGSGNMKQGLRYVVTKESYDGTFEVGDYISLCANGDIINHKAHGWIDKVDVERATRGMEVEVDSEWAERRRKKLLQELAELPCHRSVVKL